MLDGEFLAPRPNKPFGSLPIQFTVGAKTRCDGLGKGRLGELRLLVTGERPSVDRRAMLRAEPNVGLVEDVVRTRHAVQMVGSTTRVT